MMLSDFFFVSRMVFQKLCIISIVVFSFSTFLWVNPAHGDITVTSLSWEQIDETHGKLTDLSVEISSNIGGACSGSDWASDWSHKLSCKILFGDNSFFSSTDPDKMLTIFESDRSVAADQPAVIDKMYAAIGREFVIGPNAKVCFYYDAHNPASHVHVGMSGACRGGSVPPVETPVTCRLENEVIIDYGSIESTKVNGSHKTGSTVLSCNGNATVNIKIKSKSDNNNIVYLRSDNSLYSKLTLNGKDASDQGVDLEVKENIPQDIIIDSELVSSGILDAGDFSGTGVVIVSIP